VWCGVEGGGGGQGIEPVKPGYYRSISKSFFFILLSFAIIHRLLCPDGDIPLIECRSNLLLYKWYEYKLLIFFYIFL
jgi:hypothetical protein